MGLEVRGDANWVGCEGWIQEAAEEQSGRYARSFRLPQVRVRELYGMVGRSLHNANRGEVIVGRAISV